MTTFKTTLDTRTLEFKVSTTSKVTSHRGTAFVPNRLRTSVVNGAVIAFISLERVDAQGWGVDDPAGPDGAELYVSFTGSEIVGPGVAKLPKVAQDALDTIRWAIR